MFYITSILNALIQLIGLLWLQETYAPTLLARRARRLKIQTSNQYLYTEYDHKDGSILRVLATALMRPCKLLGTQLIIQILAIYVAYIYGLMYLVLSTFTSVWTVTYNESIKIAGLNYISIGLGFLLGTQICAPINDFVSYTICLLHQLLIDSRKVYKRLKLRNNNIGVPEFRSILLLPNAILVPLGFLWYGWSVQFRLHWIMPNIGVTFAAAGIITGMQSITAYIVDAYGMYAASAIAATTVLRALAGFGKRRFHSHQAFFV